MQGTYEGIEPRPQGDLVVVGATMGSHWVRDAKKVKAKIIVRDDCGNEFSFEAECVPAKLRPYYR